MALDRSEEVDRDGWSSKTELGESGRERGSLYTHLPLEHAERREHAQS